MITAVSVNAQKGLERAFSDAARAAETYVSSFAVGETGASGKLGLRSDQTVRAAVDLARARLAAKANGRVMRTGHRLTGSLIDILA